LHVLRRSLWPLAPLYGLASSIRNRFYDGGILRVHRLPVPVLSVGNLTVGGTGKTPLVMWLVERALRRGRRPGVLARGYRRVPGARLNDEGEMLERRFPGLLQVQDPDRVRGGRRLVELGADLVILDDGFQHRRLHRDRDVVCLDGRQPFADGTLLPAGDLREPRSGLRRASMCLITRAAGLTDEELRARTTWLWQISGRELPVFATEHRPVDLLLQPEGESRPAADLRSRRVVLLSGIARPESFEDTVRGLGAEIVRHLRYPDHHRFRAAELAHAVQLAKEVSAQLLVTEKDDARLQGQPERAVLRCELSFLGAEPDAEQWGLA
jgi:tetraacyldisaccharide 4'-kinase